MRNLKAFWRDEQAATAIEYALICGAIALVVAPMISSIGVSLNTAFTAVTAQLNPGP